MSIPGLGNIQVAVVHLYALHLCSCPVSNLKVGTRNINENSRAAIYGGMAI